MGNRCASSKDEEITTRNKKKANENNTPALLSGLHQDTNERVGTVNSQVDFVSKHGELKI
jgi:hypothetical protein